MSANAANSERLYALLPAIQRIRDAAEGEPLRALLAVVESQFQRVQDNIAELHDNWFVETCDEWVVPYIGDLLGVRGLRPIPPVASLRPYVANTLRYRRSKGTAAMLEGLARDVTGFRAVAVEFFRRLATTQHLNHVRADVLRTPDLRDGNALELLGGPFDSAHHFAEVRSIADRGGKYNVKNVGLFLFRLEAFELNRAPATAATALGGRYRVSQLGADLPLFNRSADDGGRVREFEVPGPLRRRPLAEELHAARVALSAGAAPRYVWFNADEPVLRVFLDDKEVPPHLIQICDLSGWTTLPTALSFDVPNPNGGTTTLTTRVSVDPVLGRLAVISGALPVKVEMDYRYGFSAPLGGGPYHRTPAPAKKVVQVPPGSAAPIDLQAQVTAWLAQNPPVTDGAVELQDNGIYSVANVSLPAAFKLKLRAAEGMRPVLKLGAPWTITLAADASFSLDGVLLTGERLEIASVGKDDDHFVAITHCTLVPGQRLAGDGTPLIPTGASLAASAAAEGRVQVALRSSICGRVNLASNAGFQGNLEIADSIVDGLPAVPGSGAAPAVQAHELTVARATVLGTTVGETLEATDAIFAAPLTIERTQVGCVRFSLVPAGSKVPRSFHCQPATAVAEKPGNADSIRARLVPAFTSERYGTPGYAQLALTGPEEIATGAEDGSEMGGFQMLHQPQRLMNLRASLEEYLRFGLEAGIFFVT